MSGDWYRDHDLSPEADPDEYRGWAEESTDG